MRIIFNDEDEQSHSIKGVKVSEADELVAAFKIIDSHVVRFYRDALNKGGSVESVGLWCGINSGVKQAVSLVLKLSGIEGKKWTEFSVSDLNKLLLDDTNSKTQSVIRKANGFNFNPEANVDIFNEENTTIHQRYLIMLLYYLGGEHNRFDDALAMCQQLTPEDLNVVLKALSEVKDGKMPEILKLKQDLEIPDERIGKLLVDAGFAVSDSY
jgi:hypothetical protein